MKKLSNENVVKNIYGKKAELVNDLYEMLPVSFLGNRVCIVTKDNANNELYERSLFDSFIDMDEDELSFIKECFGHLLEYKTVCDIKKKNERTFELLMSLLDYECESVIFGGFVIDFNEETIQIGMIDLLSGDIESITINNKKEIVLS